MIRAEQETTITYTAADDVALVYSCIRSDISALRARDGVREIESGHYLDGTPWARFEIPTDRLAIAQAVRPRLSERQLAQRASARPKDFGRRVESEAIEADPATASPMPSRSKEPHGVRALSEAQAA